jgi:hypothetical protein
MKRKTLLFCLAVFAVDLRAQQVAEIDLARHKPDKTEAQSVDVGLDGCGFPHYKNSDGVIVNADGRSKLKVELTLPKEQFERGEIADGQVLMQNVGPDAILIPWSSDPQVSNRPRGAIQHEYEVGWFELELKGAGNVSVPLESESESIFLYSSDSNSRSSLRIEPGQWVIAKFKFLLEEKQKLSVSLPLKPGKAEISVKWRQARYTWHRDGCAVETGYFNYDLHQDAKPVSIEILK